MLLYIFDADNLNLQGVIQFPISTIRNNAIFNHA